MKPDRWNRIDSLLSGALELEPCERTAFLDAACAGDQDLRREVEALLSADAQASRFIETPAAGVAAELMKDQPALVAGQQIGRYRIISLSGRGGRGAVYLAEDTTLRRRIALKLLRPDFITSEDRLRRFEQEARAASALNHPNILVIHEIGSEGDLHFIVTEFIEGETLRDRMSRSRLTLGETLDVAIQLAGALAEAHQAGIVHRDIKPENVMLRADGLVKVLDFGLAKLTEQTSGPVETEAQTLAKVDTEPGTILGTVNYMSPEQARGQAVDSRTDLFSLGAVIYEMISGRPPFEAETKTDVLASILKIEPPALSSARPDAPAELQRIAVKALRKNREERYQTARDLMIDLKCLKDDLEFESRLERSASPDVKSEATTTGNLDGVTGPVAAAETASVASMIKRTWVMVTPVLALLVAGAAAVVYFSSTNGTQTKPIDSLVILPFANANEDPNMEYLSDGIPEMLINSFSRLPRLKVMARTTAFRYKAKDVDPQRAGRELKVQAVLTGRVIRQGDRLIVQADLINVSDGSQIWGERYTRKMSDIFAVQDEIARAITDKLRLTLAGEEQKLLTKRYTNDAEAYELYLKGRHLWNGRNTEGLRKAIDYFNKAIEKDPDYALAYAGLADCYATLSNYSLLPPRDAYPKAKDAALKALALDDGLAEAHASLGIIMSNYDWDWQGAEREYKHAIELNPNYSTAHQGYGELLARVMGRDEEGIAETKRGIELDPLSSVAIANLVYIYWDLREYDLIIAQCEKIIEIDPNFPRAHMMLAGSYSKKGMREEALASALQALRLDPDSPMLLTVLGLVNARTGNKAEGRRILDRLQALSNRQYVSATYLSMLCVALGENDKALAWLEKSIERREVLFLRGPSWDGVNSDPRFRDVARRVGLPE